VHYEQRSKADSGGSLLAFRGSPGASVGGFVSKSTRAIGQAREEDPVSVCTALDYGTAGSSNTVAGLSAGLGRSASRRLTDTADEFSATSEKAGLDRSFTHCLLIVYMCTSAACSSLAWSARFHGSST
jgi:hypothetical protein